MPPPFIFVRHGLPRSLSDYLDHRLRHAQHGRVAGAADVRCDALTRNLNHGMLRCERDCLVVLALQVCDGDVVVRRVGKRRFEAGCRVVERLGGPRLGLVRGQVVVHDRGRPVRRHAVALYLVSEPLNIEIPLLGMDNSRTPELLYLRCTSPSRACCPGRRPTTAPQGAGTRQDIPGR